MEKGGLIISLDFELMWGVRDVTTIDDYGDAIINVHDVVPKLISLFRKYNTKATFATVGFLFSKNLEEVKCFIPSSLPSYRDKNLSPYSEVEKLKSIENKYYFSPKLLDLLKKNQDIVEIGTHTYSHYYCIEEGQNIEEFEADLESAIAIAKKRGIQIKSIVFPRNQIRKEYLKICANYGITSYRGVEKAWYYSSQSLEDVTLQKRAFRLLDSYINLSGHNSYKVKQDTIINLPASRFLRPYNNKLNFLEKIKLKRILNDISAANKKNEIYHLWWHPHNFGRNTEKMLNQLETILSFAKENEFHSYTMNEVANHYIER